ncbi:MAG: GDSL-type esterase/lipase family protein [Oscillospiraceae bacterium]|nr:GDSL-type esterase/lipase family protein [Oscillospiraceae bacterium]
MKGLLCMLLAAGLLAATGLVVTPVAKAVPSGALPAGNIRIACVGDSLTEGYGGSTAYPAFLQAKLNALHPGRFTVGNFGASGFGAQTTSRFNGGDGTGYYGNSSRFQPSLDFAPDIVIIAIGANDAKNGQGGDSNWRGAAYFEEEYRKFVLLYTALPKPPVIIIGNACSVRQTNFAITEALVSGQVVPAQDRVAAELGLELVDFNTASREFTADEFNADGVHLTTAGYARMADVYLEKILEIFENDNPVVSRTLTPPDKKWYSLGEIPDVAGMFWCETRADGSELCYPVTIDMLDGYEDGGGGKRLLTVTRGGVTLETPFWVFPTCPGDVDGSGAADLADARMILQHLVDKIALSPDQLISADIYGDGSVGIANARLILQKLVGKIEKFPVEL